MCDNKAWEYEDNVLETLCKDCHNLDKKVEYFDCLMGIKISISDGIYIKFYDDTMSEKVIFYISDIEDYYFFDKIESNFFISFVLKMASNNYASMALINSRDNGKTTEK